MIYSLASAVGQVRRSASEMLLPATARKPVARAPCAVLTEALPRRSRRLVRCAELHLLHRHRVWTTRADDGHHDAQGERHRCRRRRRPQRRKELPNAAVLSHFFSLIHHAHRHRYARASRHALSRPVLTPRAQVFTTLYSIFRNPTMKLKPMQWAGVIAVFIGLGCEVMEKARRATVRPGRRRAVMGPLGRIGTLEAAHPLHPEGMALALHNPPESGGSRPEPHKPPHRSPPVAASPPRRRSAQRRSRRPPVVAPSTRRSPRCSRSRRTTTRTTRSSCSRSVRPAADRRLRRQ